MSDIGPVTVSPRALRVSGFAGLVAVALVVTCVMVAPQIVAGQRVSGTVDPQLIRAYYLHPPLATLQVAVFPAAGLILLLAAGLHSLAARGRSGTLASWGLAFTIAIVPGYLLEAALQAALVSVASSGGDVLPLFRVWDVFYNSGLYALEAGYVITFSLALTQENVFPRWFRTFGVVAGLLQLANVSALWIGLPDAATIPGNLGMLSWLLIASLLLLRRANDEGRLPLRARTGLSAS